MKEILVVDDDLHIGNVLEALLSKEGYLVTRAYSGTEALLRLARSKPDLVLLDLMLPGLSGEEVLPLVDGVPVIVLSAKADADNKAALLLGGAVDYVTKPFHPKELLARIAVRLRDNSAKEDAGPERSPQLTFGGLTLDIDRHTAIAEEGEVKLTRTEYAILKLLMQNPAQVITKSQLLERIGEDTPDCTENSLKTHISHLRTKLREAGGRDYIEAVWGIGFKMKES